jgi:hypothetical protein
MSDIASDLPSQRKLAQRLRNAKPLYPAASIKDVDFNTPRGLARDVVLSLGTGAWIREHSRAPKVSGWKPVAVSSWINGGSCRESANVLQHPAGGGVLKEQPMRSIVQPRPPNRGHH